MLVLTVKKRKFVSVNNGEYLLQILSGSKWGLSMKLLKKDGDFYDNMGTMFSSDERPFLLNGKLKITHVSGKGKQIKVGFDGDYKITRCPDKFVYKTKPKIDLDDDFFNFDTEGY